MKSRTSYSKLTGFKKDVTRFAPVWLLYLIAIMLFLMDMGGYDYDSFAHSWMPDLVMSFGVVNILYAGVCALLLFGDLYNTRMCYSLHAMPQRRESWLLCHLAAGLCFSLVPNLVAALYLMARLEAYWFIALYWLLAVTMQFIFFFGVATVSALATGNRIGMIAVYAVLNFFSMIAYWIVDTIYLPQLYGVIINFDSYSQLCPVVELFNHSFFEFKSVEVLTQTHYYDTFYEYVGLGSGWGYMGILALIGLALMGFSVLLYRWRHLESAGDFVAFRRLSPVICVVLSVCVAVGFALFGDAMGSGYMLWLFVGLVVGWFGSLMLLERRVKVFRPKAFIGLGALAAVLIVSFLLVSGDVFGVVRYVPNAGQVESVTVSNYYSNSYYDGDYYYSNRMSVTLTEEADIEEITTAHQDILDRYDPSYNGAGHRVVLTYKLKNGRTVLRSYVAPASGTNYEIISKYFYTPQNIFGFTDWEEYVNSVVDVSIDGMIIPEELYRPVLDALLADCENGYVTTNPSSDIKYYAYVQTLDSYSHYSYRELAILSGAENTLKLLQTPELIMGYSDWDQFLEGVSYLAVNDTSVKAEQWTELLEAIKLDCEAGNFHANDNEEGNYYIYYEYRSSGSKDYRYIYITKESENTWAWLQANKY